MSTKATFLICLFTASALLAGCIGSENEAGASDGSGEGVPTLIWQYASDGRQTDLLGGPLLAEGIVYLLVEEPGPVLLALDARDGTELWRFAPTATTWRDGDGPAYHEGMVYMTTETNEVFAVDAKEGTEVWKAHLGRDDAQVFLREPFVVDGRVFVLADVAGETWSDEQSLHAMDATTGDALWTRVFQGYATSRSGIRYGEAETVYVVEGVNADNGDRRNTFIHAVRTDTGATRWTTDTRFYSGGVTVADGVLYAGFTRAEQRWLEARDAATGDLLWERDTLALPAVGEDTLFAPGVVEQSPDELGDPYMFAIDAGSLAEVWRTEPRQPEGQFFDRPTLVDGVLYAYNQEGRIYAIDATDGAILSVFIRQLHPGHSNVRTPIVNDGILYLGPGAFELDGDGQHNFPASDIPGPGALLAALGATGVVLWIAKRRREAQP